MQLTLAKHVDQGADERVVRVVPAQVDLSGYSHPLHFHFHVPGVLDSAGDGASIFAIITGTSPLPPGFDRRPTHNTIPTVIST